jgi:hypothetical protein
MKVERFSPDPETEPRHWVRHDQAFAMMLRLNRVGLEALRSAKVRLHGGRLGTVRSSCRGVGWTHERIASATRYLRRGTDGLF